MKETMEIPLTRGQVAIVDADDFEWLSQYKWHAHWDEHMQGYYAACSKSVAKKLGTTRMHRAIMKAKPGEIVDHIDGDGINNSKSNLRIATIRENAKNRKVSSSNTTTVTGVYFDNKSKKWVVKIQVDKKLITVGYFYDFNDAVEARKKAEEKYYGEFARSKTAAKRNYVAPTEKRDKSPSLWYMFGYGEVYCVPLTQDKYSIIDICDYEYVKNLFWLFASPGYARTNTPDGDLLLHRAIMKAPSDKVVDHINGDRLDNRRCNLRLASAAENSWNNHTKRGSSPHKNIRKVNCRFEVSMKLYGTVTWIGSFPTLEEALEARNAAYREHRGEFARYED